MDPHASSSKRGRKRKRARSQVDLSTVHTVTFIEYEDDYKHRYGSGTDVHGPYLFSTRAKADAFVYEALLAYLQEAHDNERIDLNDGYCRENEQIKYNDTFDEFRAKLAMSAVAKDFDDLMERATEAEFVDTRLDWTVDTVEVDCTTAKTW